MLMITETFKDSKHQKKTIKIKSRKNWQITFDYPSKSKDSPSIKGLFYYGPDIIPQNQQIHPGTILNDPNQKYGNNQPGPNFYHTIAQTIPTNSTKY